MEGLGPMRLERRERSYAGLMGPRPMRPSTPLRDIAPRTLQTHSVLNIACALSPEHPTAIMLLIPYSTMRTLKRTRPFKTDGP